MANSSTSFIYLFIFDSSKILFQPKDKLQGRSFSSFITSILTLILLILSRKKKLHLLLMWIAASTRTEPGEGKASPNFR